MNTVKKYKYILLGGIFLVVAVVTYNMLSVEKTSVATETESKTVSLISVKDLLNQVHVTHTTGQIDSKQSVDMKAQISGTIASVQANIGDRVYRGQVIATFNNADSYASLAQAEAGVKIQEARLSEVSGGSRNEELAVAKLTVENARIALESNRQSTAETVRNAYVLVDDVIHHKLDVMFSNPRNDAKLVFGANNQTLENKIQSERNALEGVLSDWNVTTSNLSASSDLTSALIEARSILARISKFTDDMAQIVNNLEPSNLITATTITSYQSAVSGARTSISGQSAAIVTAQTTLSSTATSYEQAKQQLTIKESGGTSDQVKAQQAQLDQAKANLLAAQAQYAKSIITSPINGEIASLPIKVGQYVGINQTVTKIVNKSNLHVKAYINTSDISFVKSGDVAEIEGVGVGEVLLVSPGIDPTNGKIEIEISLPKESSKEIIEGEYVTVMIQSKKEGDVQSGTISLPLKAVKVSSKGASVYILKDGVVTEVPVEVGDIIGSEVEVVSGVDASMSILESTRGVLVGDVITID